MMFRYCLILVFLFFGVAACSPATSNIAESQTQTTESNETHNGEPEPEADHAAEHAAEDEHEEGEHREHGAHEHGAATLTVAWSGTEMEIELNTPAFNLFGFEYEPSTDDEIQLVEDAVQALESGNLLIINAEAACRLSNSDITTGWDHEGEQAADAGHDEADHEEGETHSDVRATFSLVCDSPDEIRSLDLSPLFNRFPNLEALEAQVVSDMSQSAAELTSESPLLTLQ
jgi:hypothetical protein